MNKISIGIVTFNSSSEIMYLLNSIFNSSVKEEIDVFVIDNNSKDNTVELIKANFPQVNIIENSMNLGFGKAHNQIIERIKSEYHIIINPDIRFKEDVIENLMKIMDKNTDYVICSPHIIGEDGKTQYLPKRKPKLKYILSGKLESKYKFFGKIRDQYTMKNVELLYPTEIEFCTGCFMFTRTKALKNIGGFDERYFLHFEDVDLTLEMKREGKTMYIPNISIIHKWHRDNIKNSNIQKIAMKSMLKFFLKWGFKNV